VSDYNDGAPFSPGPWTHGHHTVRDAYDEAVAYDVTAPFGGLDQHDVVRENNGRLIAAAPEMLALLREFDIRDMARDHDEETHDAIGALIARIDDEGR
jgi:hypothetical protein